MTLFWKVKFFFFELIVRLDKSYIDGPNCKQIKFKESKRKKKKKIYETLKLNSKNFQVRGHNLKNNKINSCLSI